MLRDSHDEREITVHGPVEWSGADFFIPGDFSTAAYFLAAGLLVRRSDLRIPDIGANPTRTGLLAVLSTMVSRDRSALVREQADSIDSVREPDRAEDV